MNLRLCTPRSLYDFHRISLAMVMLDDGRKIANAEFVVKKGILNEFAPVPKALALGFELNIACDGYVG